LVFIGSALIAVNQAPKLIKYLAVKIGWETKEAADQTAGRTADPGNQNKTDTPPPTKSGAPEIVVVRPPGSGQVPGPPEELGKKQLADIIGQRPLKSDEIHSFTIQDEQGHALFVQTTVDPALQSWAMGLMPHVGAYSTALVVMNPTNGEVMVMASYRGYYLFYNSPMKLLEYMAAGKAVLITALGQIKELNQDGHNGMRFEWEDNQAMHRKLMWLLE
ncbi:MAG: glycosyltransferase, partial [Deltaproteobacteria bacterium]|nr:glycosyltransferase [Deltaproteobacteria bacterium]